MNLSTVKLTKDEQALALIEKHKAEEIIHKLVIKIISWKSGLLEGADIKGDNKITSHEWRKYRTHILNISKVESSERVQDKLKQTQDLIKKNGGFK